MSGSQTNSPVLKDGDFAVFSAKGTDNELFGNVLRVRGHEHAGPNVFHFDDYSSHYVLFAESKPIGCLTATRLQDGPIDCQEFYPAELLSEFGHLLFSCCKLRIVASPNASFQRLRCLIRAGWRHQLQHGARIDLMNAQSSFQAFYQRIGYRPASANHFRHPTLGTESVAMFLAADPNHASFCREEFRGISRPVYMDDVRDILCD